MMKIVHRNCCGIDVHKKFVVATIAITDANDITTHQTKRFETFTEDLTKLKDWLISQNCKDVCMESTGKYWIPVFNILETACNCVITHPKYVRTILGKKTDKKDSIWIAEIFKHGLVEPSFMPTKNIREIRDLMRYRNKLVNIRTGEKNRFQNSLTVSNVMIANVLTDTFGKTSQGILKLLLDNKELSIDDIKAQMRKRVKASAEDILKSVKGTFSSEQNAKMQVCLSHYEHINNCIETLEETVINLVIPFKKELSLISSVPGIKDISAIFILGEIGNDMSVFVDDKHLCSWAGLTPRCNESANKKKSVRITRAGVYLKPLLVQCANNAIKDKSCPYFRLKYESLKKRRGHNKAIIAIARILLSIIYHLLIKGETFDYNKFEETTKRNFHRPKALNIDNAIELLKSQGYNVSINQ